MSAQMTSVCLGHGIGGISDYGYHSRARMIKLIRAYWQGQKEIADKILAAADSDFVVEQHTGIVVRKNIVRLEP